MQPLRAWRRADLTETTLLSVCELLCDYTICNQFTRPERSPREHGLNHVNSQQEEVFREALRQPSDTGGAKNGNSQQPDAVHRGQRGK